MKVSMKIIQIVLCKYVSRFHDKDKKIGSEFTFCLRDRYGKFSDEHSMITQIVGFLERQFNYSLLL